MRNLLNKLKILNIIALYGIIINIVNATVTYTKDGVLREEGSCSINFVNFGIDDNSYKSISSITISYSNNVLTIGKLKNGNLGLNKNMSFTANELKKYIIISKDGNKITDNYTMTNNGSGLFTISISNLNSCKGITVKQTFKENVKMYTYLLYENVVPNPINKGFSSDKFGPSSNNTPYSIIYWNMDGLDEIREKCQIYIQFHNYSGDHFIWYLSKDNINGSNCSNTEFYNIAKKYYPDYSSMTEIFGDHYEGYVIKRETDGEGHMDGVVVNQNYIVEMYQQQCGNQNGYQVICTISSLAKLSFSEFTSELINNCLSIIIDKTEIPTYEVDANGITMKFKSYTLLVTNNGKGSLPTSKTGSVSYKEFSGVTSSGVARFKASMSCYDGSYKDANCRCR
eukprot:jgi/Orpsp1_1/1182017/evm.model.c7180000079551.1